MVFMTILEGLINLAQLPGREGVPERHYTSESYSLSIGYKPSTAMGTPLPAYNHIILGLAKRPYYMFRVRKYFESDIELLLDNEVFATGWIDYKDGARAKM